MERDDKASDLWSKTKQHETINSIFIWLHFKFKDDKQSSDESTAELGLPNVGGVFIVLTAGIVMAFLISIGEFLWNVRKIAVKEHVSSFHYKTR